MHYGVMEARESAGSDYEYHFLADSSVPFELCSSTHTYKIKRAIHRISLFENYVRNRTVIFRCKVQVNVGAALFVPI